MIRNGISISISIGIGPCLSLPGNGSGRRGAPRHLRPYRTPPVSARA